MLELYDLEKLVAFKTEGTLVAASEKLLISQPALSRSMRKLEDEFGVELFTRSRNRMELNENGRPEAPGLECVGFGSEKLCFLLPVTHPLAGARSLRLADLDGETMLLRPNLGFWADVLKAMPGTRFIVQEENYAFGELLRASSLPAFTTDRVQRRNGVTDGRTTVPISDEGTSVDYFVAYRASDKRRLADALKVVEVYAR